MLPIIEIPKRLDRFLDNFKDIFSYHQLRRAKQYVIGLITSTKRFTVASISSRFIDKPDQSSLNRFLTEYEWNMERMNERRIQLMKKRVKCTNSIVVFDDTIIHKAGKLIPGVMKLYDHSESRYVNGQCIVTTHYIGNEDYPPDIAQYTKEKTKIELAIELIDKHEKRQLGNTYVFDPWYLAEDIVKAIEKKGRNWVSRLKSNRLLMIKGKKVNVTDFYKSVPRKKFKSFEIDGKRYRIFTKVVQVNKLGRIRLVISEINDDVAFLVTNRKDWDAKKVIGCYTKRFEVETYYKDAKQNLGLEGCQLRAIKGIRSHWYLAILAYSFLKLELCNSSLYRKVKTIGNECRQKFNELLSSLVTWIYKQANEHLPLDKILGVILR